MEKYSEAIVKTSNGYMVMALLILYLLFPLYVLKQGEEKLIQYAGQNPVLDLKLYYSADEAYSCLESLGPEGRMYYGFFEKIVDPIYMIMYSLLLVFSVAFLVRKRKMEAKWQALVFLPFLVGLMDFAENACIIRMLQEFPKRNYMLVNIGSAFTTLKWVSSLFAILPIVLLMPAWLMKVARVKIANAAL